MIVELKEKARYWQQNNYPEFNEMDISQKKEEFYIFYTG